MKKLTTWNKFLIIAGIYLLADGVLSILLSSEQGITANVVRLIRAVIGVVVIIKSVFYK